MVRGGGKKVENAPQPANPDVEERKRLKKLAFSKGMLSDTPLKAAAAAQSALHPSKMVIKHHGKDIIRKSQRSKNRYLFSFPGLLAPVSGGKIGELKDLGTKNPILYLDFPQGQMKLFGTIVYPKNRYLSLQFSRGGKNVVCDDYFDNMIVFSDSWWIGKKDENPEELCLEFPKELTVHQNMECDFKGGAGGARNTKQGINKTEIRFAEPESPKLEEEDDSIEDQMNVKDFVDITPTRHSARTAGKRFNFADASSGDDLTAKDAETSDEEEQKEEKIHASGFDVDNEDVVILDLSADKSTPTPGAKVASTSKEPTHSNHGSLIQATISTLFKKVGEKGVSPKKKGKASEETKAGREITIAKKQSQFAKPIGPARVCKKKTKNSVSDMPKQRRGETRSSLDPSSSVPIDSSQAEDEEDIEEFSSTSQDVDESDEDWTA